jgi:hypothetical protein
MLVHSSQPMKNCGASANFSINWVDIVSPKYGEILIDQYSDIFSRIFRVLFPLSLLLLLSRQNTPEVRDDVLLEDHQSRYLPLFKNLGIPLVYSNYLLKKSSGGAR